MGLDEGKEKKRGTSYKKKYLDFNTYLRSKFYTKVQKVVVDADFSCPNRDGTVGLGGCIYCNERGSGSGKGNISIKEQVLQGIRNVKQKKPDCKIMVYFQAFSSFFLFRRHIPWSAKPMAIVTAKPFSTAIFRRLSTSLK